MTDLDALCHLAFINDGFPRIVHFPRKRLGLRDVASGCFDYLSYDLLKRMNLVIEEDNSGRKLHVDIKILFLIRFVKWCFFH